MKMKKGILNAVISFVVALTIILSGTAMSASFDFRENEQISSSDVDIEDTTIIDDLQTLDDENPPMPLTVIELLNEDFTVAVPPAGWTESQLGEWYQGFIDIDPPTSVAGGVQPEACMDYATPLDDYAYLRTVPVDSTFTPSLTLEFKSMIMDYSGVPTYSCYVKVRADSGDTWTDVTPWSNPITGDVGEFCNAALNTHTIDVSPDIGTATQVMFEFVGEDYDINFWFLDDVKLYRGGGHITPVSIQPPSQMVEKGQSFTVSVFVEPSELIMGVTMGLISFDPNLIQANSVTEGDLFGTSLMWDPGDIDNTAGTITDAYVLAVSSNAVSDPGNFADIEFTVIDIFGGSQLHLEGMIVASVASGELPVEIDYGEIIITQISPEISDVVLTASEPLDTDFPFGWENITCNVIDTGVGVDEVKLVVTDPVTTEHQMTNIPDTDTYYINTTFTIEGCNSYHVWADDFNDNYIESPSQLFELPPNEDVDNNGHIHFMDLVAIVLKYGEYGPRGGWVREDVDNNGQVHFMDLVEIVMRYGEYWGAHFPEISNVTLTHSDPLDTEPGIGWENVSCTVTNANIDDVKLIVTNPIEGEYLMTNIPETDTYYYYTTFTAIGCYEYYIWADDIYDNYVESSIEQFELPPNEDVNMDGCVTQADLIIPPPPIGGWYGPPGWMREDVDNNGAITFMDGVAIMLHYGEYWDRC